MTLAWPPALAGLRACSVCWLETGRSRPESQPGELYQYCAARLSRPREIFEPLSLIFVIASVIASCTHGVSRDVIGHSSAQAVCAHARCSKVNASEDARVGDFCYCVRETSERTQLSGSWICLRVDSKRRVLSKRGGQNKRG